MQPSTLQTGSEARESDLATVEDLRRALERDAPGAWQAFDAEYRRRLVSFARLRFQCNGDEASEIAQEALIRFYRTYATRTDRLKAEQPIFPWLAVACRNVWIDAGRKGRRPVKPPEDWDPAGDPDPQRDTNRILMRLDYRECQQRLKRKEPQYLSLYQKIRDGSTFRELERETALSRGMINRQVLEAKDYLRNCMEAKGWSRSEFRGSVQ